MSILEELVAGKLTAREAVHRRMEELTTTAAIPTSLERPLKARPKGQCLTVHPETGECLEEPPEDE